MTRKNDIPMFPMYFNTREGAINYARQFNGIAIATWHSGNWSYRADDQFARIAGNDIVVWE